MQRTRSFRRSQRERVINWKKKFIKLAGDYWHYEHEGVLSKGKIHCSCGMCRYSRTHKELIKKKEELLEIDMKEQIAETCQSCQWKSYRPAGGWCYCWFTQPNKMEDCHYDRG